MKGALGLSLTFVAVLTAELLRSGALTPAIELYSLLPERPDGASEPSPQSLRIELYDPFEESVPEPEAAPVPAGAGTAEGVPPDGSVGAPSGSQAFADAASLVRL